MVLSLGPNANGVPPPESDEARNQSGAPVLVHREASAEPGNEFDDLVAWTPVHLVVSRLLAAGLLP